MTTILVCLVLCVISVYVGYVLGFSKGKKSQESIIEHWEKRYKKLRKDYITAARG